MDSWTLPVATATCDATRHKLATLHIVTGPSPVTGHHAYYVRHGSKLNSDETVRPLADNNTSYSSFRLCGLTDRLSVEDAI